MNGEYERGATSIDWRLVVTGIGVFWAIGLGAGSLFRSHLLASVDQRIATHSEEAAAKRVEFFRHVESEAGTAVGRIATLEQHAASIRDWRPAVDAGLSAVRDTCQANSQKVERILQWIEGDTERVRQLSADVERLKERQNRGK